MNALEASILAVVQGLTEFLPVSSSGHLALAAQIMDIPEASLSFDIVLHLGTLLAVFAYYWKDITNLCKGIFTRDRKSINLGLTLIGGTLPVAIVGYLFGDFITSLRESIVFVSSALVVTGFILFVTSKIPEKKENESVSFKRGLLVGIAQTIAIFPGISRSGTTICTGLSVGLSRSEAARFSFLLAIPAILGAAVKELPHASWNIPFSNIIIGFVVSALVGFAALTLLVKFVKAGKLSGFAWYCWSIAVAGFVMYFVKGM